MSTSITKTFSVTVKFSRDDQEDLAADLIAYTELKKELKKSIGEIVTASKGILSSHIVGDVSET